MTAMDPAIPIVMKEPFEPTELVDFMRSAFPHPFAKVLEVWEKYTLERHTLMVLSQYEKYFSRTVLPAGLENGHFRLFLALHDLGKPQAEVEGDKRRQTIYNPLRFEEHYPRGTFISEPQRALLKSFLTADPIGTYLRYEGARIEDCLGTLEEMHSQASWTTKEEYLRLFLVYYMSDAGSYTLDAGGLKSLDYHFRFGKDSMDFSDTSKPRVDALRRRFV